MFIYDLEIANPIPPRTGKLIDGIKYSKGWNYPATMDIACIGVYDYSKDTTRVFGEYELEEFQEFVNDQDCFVGFNNIGFDNAVLRACDIKISDDKSYDILSCIYRALGSKKKGCKLDDVVKANFPSASGKSGNGAEAPIWWQKGYHTKVIDYCLNDVRLTKMLMDRIIRNGWIINPLSSTRLYLPRPH